MRSELTDIEGSMSARQILPWDRRHLGTRPTIATVYRARSVRTRSLLVKHRMVGNKVLGHRLGPHARGWLLSVGVGRVRFDLFMTRATVMP
jgi:hypothetical protein